jgi:hypothetical protein
MATTSTSRRPTHYLYAVTKRDDAKASWVRIGAAWANGDGKGFSLKLDLMPVNGADIVMREPKDEGDAQ